MPANAGFSWRGAAKYCDISKSCENNSADIHNRMLAKTIYLNLFFKNLVVKKIKQKSVRFIARAQKASKNNDGIGISSV